MLRIVLTSFTVIALMGMAGCATILKGSSAPVSINSTPSSANVEIKRTGGIVIQQGQTPMTARLGKGKDYIVTISLDGYQTQNVPIIKGGVEPTLFCNIGLAGGVFIGVIVDYVTGAMFNLEPDMISVSLQKVTATSGDDEVLYALLTIVDEDGKQSHTAVEMAPVATD